MIVADTGAVLALIDKSDPHHAALKRLFLEAPDDWRLPWAILPEVDYLLATRLGAVAEAAFLADLADGAFIVEWGTEDDLDAAARINQTHAALGLGLVDAVVIALAERLRPRAIATLDVRHFGAIRIAGSPKLLPRDGGAGGNRPARRRR